MNKSKVVSLITLLVTMFLFSSVASAESVIAIKLFDPTGTGANNNRGFHIYGSTTVDITVPVQRAVISSTPDGTGNFIVDNRLLINGQNVCIGFTGDQSCFSSSKGGYTFGAPIETALNGINPLDVTRFLVSGTNTFQLQDFSGIYGNTVLYLVITSSPIVTADIDIKPGDDANCFNNDGHGVIPVAVLGSASFNVYDIVVSTVSLEGMSVRIAGKSDRYQASYDDTNGDGFMDLVVQIADADGVWSAGQSRAELAGLLADGTRFAGTDLVCVVQ